jgi:hypothetical protein
MDPEPRAAVDELPRPIDLSILETWGHFDVVGVVVRGEVPLVAEGVTALSERVGRVETNLRAEPDRTIESPEARGRELGQRYGDLESALRRLEASR